MKNKKNKLIKMDAINKQEREFAIQAMSKGELGAWMKHPTTHEFIKVHPDIVKRMQKGESISVDEIIKKSFSIINH